jgi:hypothetical protein
MFVGHFAVAFAAKPAAPRASLSTLMVAAALADLLWIVFLVAGLEHVEIVPGLMASRIAARHEVQARSGRSEDPPSELTGLDSLPTERAYIAG